MTSRAKATQLAVFVVLAIALSFAMTPRTLAAPTIDYPPAAAATIVGGRAVFTVIASGQPPLTYQWRKNAVDLSNGPRVSGATTDALRLADVSAEDAGDYSVVVTDALGSATSTNAALTVGAPQSGDVDFSFNPGSSINGSVLALAVQPNGKVLIGGDVTSLSDAARGGIARLNPDGSTDHTFGNGLAGANDDVYALAVQPDGRVLIGGDFTTVNGVGRSSVARLNVDGSLDTTFLNGLAGANSTVLSLVVQPDGRVLIGGGFTAVNGVGRNYVARLNANGSLDTTFLNGLAGADGGVQSIAVQPDGRVLIGGFFTTVNGVGRNHLARLNADGSLDTTFQNGLAGTDSWVYSLAVQPDGRVLMGGFFTTVNGVSRNYVARLNANGSLDTTFLNGLAGVNSWVNSLAVQPDGRVLIAGEFTTVNGTSRNRIARLNTDGALDTTFLNGLNGANISVYSLVVQSDGIVFMGGGFTSVNGVSRNRVARLNSNGALDTTFLNGLAGANGDVHSLAVQPDGRVLVGGFLTAVNGVSRNRVARLNADGSLDTSFLNGLVGANNLVHSLAVQPDGRVLIGGLFTRVNGVIRNSVARLNADGSLDTTYLDGLSGANDWVYSMALQQDGRALMGGEFTMVNGVSRNRIARLNADGSLDTSFLNGLAGATDAVYALAVQPDGRVLIGGFFTTVHGVSRNGIARLNADGSLDPTFLNGLTGTNSGVRTIAVQPDGRVLIGGVFSAVNGVGRNRMARLNADGSLDTTFLNGLTGANSWVYSMAVLADGQVLIGGEFTTINGVGRNRVARLNADGSVETTFLSGLAGVNDAVHALAVYPEGRVLVGGSFGGVNGAPRTSIARMSASAPVAPSITLEPSSRTSYDGCCAVFHVEATGTSLVYQWRKDGVDLADGPGVAGAHTATLALSGVSSAADGDYSVVVSNLLGSDTSLDAALAVAAVPACKVATCDPVLGCVIVDAANGTSCTDGNACTSGDSCNAGACAGACSCLTAADNDVDGFGNPGAIVLRCDAVVPPGSVANAGDCNDADADIHPGATEVCNLVDEDCDGVVDDGVSTTFYVDADGDFYGDTGSAIQACVKPAGYIVTGLDCDDTDPTVRPSGPERCDGKRNDCHGVSWPAILDDDSDLIENACETCSDADGDGFGDPGELKNLCAVDNCPLDFNAEQSDGDFDGIGDACDVCPLDPTDDQDFDGRCGDVDNCPAVANAKQANADGDNFGDACDLCPSVVSKLNRDRDGDGLGNACDPDVDGDGLPNGIDPNDDNDAIPDDDGDGIADPCTGGVRVNCDDNCPFDLNSMQPDHDNDGIGDACDTSDGLVGGSVAGLTGSGTHTLSWEREDGAVGYNVYSGMLDELRLGSYGSCFRRRLVLSYTTLDSTVSPGTGRFYLVTAVHADHEGGLGYRGDQTERPMPTPCP